MWCTGSCLVQLSTANSSNESLQWVPAGTPAALVLNLGTVWSGYVLHRTLGILQTLQKIKLFSLPGIDPRFLVRLSRIAAFLVVGVGKCEELLAALKSHDMIYGLMLLAVCLEIFSDLCLFCVHNWLLIQSHYCVCGFTDNFTSLRVQVSPWILRT